jgi:hypothetical protein
VASHADRPDDGEAMRSLVASAPPLGHDLPALVRAERAALVAALRAERIEALVALDSTVQEAMQRSTAVIDHAFWRLAQLTAALLIGAALVVLAGRWRRRVGIHR